MEENPAVTEIILCDCNSTEHQMIIYYDKDDEFGEEEVYVHLHLINNRGFWNRLKYGIKYIFGYKSKFGAWDEMVLKPSDADKFQTMVDFLKRVDE